MTKKLTSRRTMNAHDQHMWQLWRIRKALELLAWSVFGLGVAYVVNAVAGRIWP